MKSFNRAAALIGLSLASIVIAHPDDEIDGAQGPNGFHTHVKIEIKDGERIITCNGIPNHETGQFPGPANPGKIAEQTYEFHMPAEPKMNKDFTTIGSPGGRLGRGGFVGSPPLLFGVAFNGVAFDPTTAEWFRDDSSTGWHIEAIGPTPKLGIDQNHAHVQPPTGTYHYHGLPTALVNQLAGDDKGKKMVLVAWAADGFPTYAMWGYSDPKDSSSKVINLKSSYKLKKGSRPDDKNSPGGKYDGTYEQDYEFVESSGDLDKANGRFGVTPEFPKGTYYYVLTDSYPYVPRWFKGTPDQSFRHRPPQGRQPPERPAGPPRN